jgi:hypothetical protein
LFLPAILKNRGNFIMTVEDWAVMIAEEIAPEEVEDAPEQAEAFIAGGRRRGELFARTNAQVGGFISGEIIGILPVVLNALAIVAPAFIGVISSETTGKFLEAVKNALAVGEIFSKSNGWFSWFSSRKGEKTAEIFVVPPDVYDRLNDITAKLDKELRVFKLEQAECDRINLTVMKLLFEHNSEATEFLSKLTEKK